METLRLTVPEIGEEEVAAVSAVLRTGFLVQGEHVRAFEERVAAATGTAHAVAVSSGTAALHLALLAVGVGPGDEVVLPAFTHPATANVVELVGARPVLVDVDLATLNADPEAMLAAVSPRTKALMPVHLFGQPAEMAPLLRVASERRLRIVEDAACALGSAYHGRACGSMGDVGCFSFHPRKIVTTGEGGMLTTNDARLAEHLRRLRNHGQVLQDGRGRFVEAGLNYRLTEFQGALGVAQMDRLESILTVRARLAETYGRALQGLPSVLAPRAIDGGTHSWQSYVVVLAGGIDRDAVQRRLREDGIETTLGTYALTAQPHYAAHPPLPMSRAAQDRSLALPLHTRMGAAEVERVCAALRRAVAS